MDTCIELKKKSEEKEGKGQVYTCNCLIIDFENRLKYLNYIKKKYNITDRLLHTLYLSNRNELRSYMKHYYNFDINDLD